MSSITKHAPTAARLVLGLLFTVFGLNGFLGFMPPPPLSEAGGAFLGALAATGYMFPLIKGTEMVSGLLLLANRQVPLALTLLAPLVVNIVAFHAFLSPGGIEAGLLALGVGLYVAWTHREAFAPMFRHRLGAEASAGTEPSLRAARTPA